MLASCNIFILRLITNILFIYLTYVSIIYLLFVYFCINWFIHIILVFHKNCRVNYNILVQISMPHVKLRFCPFFSSKSLMFIHLLCCTLSGVNIGGAGSYVYDTPANNNPSPTGVDSAPKAEEKRVFVPKAASKGKWEACFHTEYTLNCGSISKCWLE